jgi:glycerol-3-phosphate cytidylyltransferase|tara:strand:- start:500 stop:970 length:471 start_codon:yes stop_codon:yes gene_type:complete
MRENITGFIASSFDIYHPGYALMLKECKDNCDYLVVALHDNPKTANQDKNSPIMSLHERFLVLKSIRYIDEVAPYKSESDLVNLLHFYKPDVRFLGSDYNSLEGRKKISGYFVCKNIYYVDRFHDYSSSDIRKKIYDAELCKEKLEEFIQKEAIHE